MQKTTVPIFYAADDAYAPFLAVSLKSLLDNADKKYFYKIHILASNMCEKNRNRISSLVTENSKITFVNPEKRLAHIMNSLSLRDYYSVATYYRLFIANMFTEYTKVLYIDSDTVVPGDISKMYFTEIGENLVGAVPESVMLQDVFGRYSEKVLNVSRFRYFNAGILLMNLKKFREDRIEEKFLDLLARVKLPVAQDQDYLNILCKDRVYYFPHDWNLVPADDLPFNSVHIVHYKMAMRPWHYDGIKYGDIFWRYAEKTKFYGDICEIKRSRTPDDARHDREVFESLSALAESEMERVDAERNAKNAETVEKEAEALQIFTPMWSMPDLYDDEPLRYASC